MCGIVGFTGNHQAAPILLYGLSRLEYRGYDSAGLAVRDGEGDTEVIKAKGRLKVLADKTNNGESVPGTCGIGHTRWATHGEPSETNAHPHMSDDGNVVAVHNGIIENYQELKDKLIRNGYEFYSSTDTEVAILLPICHPLSWWNGHWIRVQAMFSQVLWSENPRIWKRTEKRIWILLELSVNIRAPVFRISTTFL